MISSITISLFHNARKTYSKYLKKRFEWNYTVFVKQYQTSIVSFYKSTSVNIHDNEVSNNDSNSVNNVIMKTITLRLRFRVLSHQKRNVISVTMADVSFMYPPLVSRLICT